MDKNSKHLETIVGERDLFVMRGSQDSLKCSSVSRDISSVGPTDWEFTPVQSAGEI